MSDDDIPKLLQEDCLENESDSDSDEEKWIEGTDDEADEETRCLFSDKKFPNIEEAISYLKSHYKFDLGDLKKKYAMDFYSFIKMVNFIRHKNIKDPSQLFGSDRGALWLDDEFLKPAGDYEPWLSYDFDQLDMNDMPEFNGDPKLVEKIKELQAQVEAKDQLISQVLDDKERMKEAYKHLLSKEAGPAVSEKPTSEQKKVENGVASLPLDDDNGYFETYAHFSIHHSMLSDKVRTESYRGAILKNSEVIKSKIVMDLGCGTSILSMFASQAGAKTVYAVDQSDIIYQAMEIAQTNKFSNIKFVKGRLEDVKLPVEKVDVIVSEWMGYFLLFEGMLDSVIYARKNYLKEGGLLMPNRCTISLAGYGCEERYNNFIKFFDNVYGFEMKCMLKNILREAHVERCDEKFVVTKPNVICELDLMTCDLSYSSFTYDFDLEVTKDTHLTSFVGYFDTFFDLPQPVSFSTSPEAPPTHWQQTIFYLDQPVEVKSGDHVKGKFICRRDRNDLRSLNIEISVFGKVFKYDIN